MNISLTHELEQYVQKKVSSGLYTSASEVIRESLRLMHTCEGFKEQRIEQLNADIEIGLSQLEAGDKVIASQAYKHLKKKIKNTAKKNH